MPIRGREAAALSVGVVLLVAAFAVPHLGLGTLTPIINSTPERVRAFADTAPIFGWWEAHVGWGTVPALLIAAAVVRWGPDVAGRLRWRSLVGLTWATSLLWAFSLAMVDGWERGFAGRLTARHEYLRQVPTITDIPEAVRTFSARILDFQPDSWITHVSGHPPAALLSFVWLDRIGLGGGAWAGLFCLLVGSSAAAAIIIAIRAVADEATARLAAPFVAVAPTAIWIAVSADGYFAGVAAWGIALLALAVHGRPRRAVPGGGGGGRGGGGGGGGGAPARRGPGGPGGGGRAGPGAGLLLGWGIFLNYGIGLIALPAVAVLLTATDRRSALRALVPAVIAALAVVAAFYAAGFWWFDGYHLVQERYWQGIANDRPFQYWVWANLASTVCAIGLGSVAALGHVFDARALRRRSGLHLLLTGALLSIILADLSMLSKAETERIWLPFTVWLTAAGALLPPRSHRWWLALNVVGALAINHLILTNW
ncbi:hypothetical protein AB4Z39_19320 [Mycobacterium adipatum]|uniref:hypothetical protein n=1 Tax=Mycobacterium adipatum TaxID=1682113 RepID=UPI0034E0ADF3